MRFKTLKKALGVAFASLLAIAITASVIMGENASVINGALHITPYRTETIDGDDGEYPRYYNSQYKNIRELHEDGFSCRRRNSSGRRRPS